MRSPSFFAALLALSTRAMAAQILAAPLDIPAPESLSVAVSAQILSEPQTPGLAGYENLVLASVSAESGAASEAHSRLAQPAAFALGSAAAFLCIGLWRLDAERRRRASLHRRKRTFRQMAHI